MGNLRDFIGRFNHTKVGVLSWYEVKNHVNILAEWFVLDSSLEEDVSGLYSLVTKLEADLCLYKPVDCEAGFRPLTNLTPISARVARRPPDSRSEHLYRVPGHAFKADRSAEFNRLPDNPEQDSTRCSSRRLWRWIRMYGYDAVHSVPDWVMTILMN